MRETTSCGRKGLRQLKYISPGAKIIHDNGNRLLRNRRVTTENKGKMLNVAASCKWESGVKKGNNMYGEVEMMISL